MLTILAFGTTESSSNPLRLDFVNNAGSLFDWSVADGPSQPNRGLVTGFNDVAIGETPIPAVGAGIPLILGAGGLVTYYRRRKAAKA